MAWSGSSGRTVPLPKNWRQIRGKVLKRDGFRCTEIREDTQRRCRSKATDVDHGDNGPDDHSLANLRSLCSHHHDQRTAEQGGRAAAQRKKSKAKRHPGITYLD